MPWRNTENDQIRLKGQKRKRKNSSCTFLTQGSNAHLPRSLSLMIYFQSASFPSQPTGKSSPSMTFPESSSSPLLGEVFRRSCPAAPALLCIEFKVWLIRKHMKMLAGDHGAKAARMCTGQLNNFKCLFSFQKKKRETTEQHQEKKKMKKQQGIINVAQPGLPLRVQETCNRAQFLFNSQFRNCCTAVTLALTSGLEQKYSSGP